MTSRRLKHFKHHKSREAFNNIECVGEINVGDGWVMAFASSFDGKYFAAAVQNKIALYEVVDAPPYLNHVRDFVGHTNSVSDIDFTSSNDNLLVSGSLDHTVKVWHVSQDNCLATFRHEDVISAVRFNPANPSMIVVCTFSDAIVWNIGDNSVMANLDGLVQPLTACGFSPDGSLLAIGNRWGLCTFYAENKEFRGHYGERYTYKTSFVSGPRKKKPTEWKKVTSIVFLSNELVFVSTNDDRVRLYSTVNYSLVRKYVGHRARDERLRVVVSPDGTMIMMGSEKKSEVFIWDVDHERTHEGKFIRDRNTTVEGFQIPRVSITSTEFLRTSTREKLRAVIGDDQGTLHIITSE